MQTTADRVEDVWQTGNHLERFRVVDGEESHIADDAGSGKKLEERNSVTAFYRRGPVSRILRHAVAGKQGEEGQFPFLFR